MTTLRLLVLDTLKEKKAKNLLAFVRALIYGLGAANPAYRRFLRLSSSFKHVKN